MNHGPTKTTHTDIDWSYGSVNVGRALIVGVGQHGDDTDENGLHRVNGQPPLLWFLVAPLVLSRLVQYGYTHIAVLLHWGLYTICVCA